MNSQPGLAQAKEAIVRGRTAIVVEGYFDCVVLADAGFAHVVSPLGTALTVDQARLLKRYAETIILAFDADAAGEQATLRGIDLLVESGLEVRIAQLPPGVDPDECLRSLGRERFQQLLDQGVGIFEFLVQSALRRHPGEQVEDKVKAAQFVLPTIAKVPDAMLRSEYVRLLADRLRLDAGAVSHELGKVPPRANAVHPVTESRAPTTRSIARGPERLLTALLLNDPSQWQQVQTQLSLGDITDPTLRRVLSVIVELEMAGPPPTPAQVISRLTEEGLAALVTELIGLAQSIASGEHALRDCLRRLHADTESRELSRLRERIRAAQETGQEDEVQQLLVEYQRHLNVGA
jgi:DNA primase